MTTSLDREVQDAPEVADDGHALHVTSLSKALMLLSAFRGVSPPLGVSELARRAGLPKSTAFRFLTDLERAGFVERDGTDYYLGIALFELGARVRVCRPNGLRDIAMRHLSQLHVTTGHNAHLAILSGTDVMYLAKVNNGQQTLRNHFQPGARHPASCSALGKAMLAFGPPENVREVIERGLQRRTKYSITDPHRFLRELTRIRAEGVAFEFEEASLGVAAVAAPVDDGEQVSAIALSRVPPVPDRQRLATLVRATATAIAREHRAMAPLTW